MKIAREGRTRLLLAGTMLALVALSSCVPVFSIHPLYTDKDVVFDPHLLGTWFEPPSSDDHSVVMFERLNTDAYTISITDPTKQPSPVETYQAHLVQLNNRLFIDAVQSDIKVGGDNALVLAVAGHMFGRISLGEDGLRMSFLDDEWIEKALRDGMISIPHETTDDGTPVLTATTLELERFVLAHADDAKAFSIAVGPLERRK
ncbi:MAG TPA: hypothetical protein VEJ67_16115 [Candidatus Cybelea sp.]|nr:hypothetical protein [Candidatus Cybelea sp.]